MTEHNHIEIAEPASQTTMYTGAGASGAVWYLELGDTLALVAAIATILGAAFSIYFAFRRDKRQRELHALQVKNLMKQPTKHEEK